MRLSLRARLLVVPAVVVAGAVALATLLEHAAQRRWLIARESDQLLRVTREAARTAAQPTARGRLFADSLDARFALRATMMAADGTVLADSRAQAATMENHAGREEMRAALEGRPGFGVRRSATVGVDFLYCAVPLSPPREGAAVLRLAEPLVVVSRLGDALTRVSTTAAALALLASIFVLAGVSARFARRLEHLRDVARRIGEGDADVRAPEAPRDDLGHLGRALNDMRSQLGARHDALKRERDDRERILAHMSDGVALLDSGDRIVHVNHRFADLLDAAWRPEPGVPFASFARIPELIELLAESRREGRTLERDLKPWATRAGSARATVTPLGGPRPEPVLIVLHDLSESEAVQRMRQDFVANVSHELRTPLTTLRGYAETLLEGGLDDAGHREEFVRSMRDGALRLQALVEDLLALAELERPDAALRREPLDLRALAAEHVDHVRGAAERAGLELVLEPGPPVNLSGDRVRLAQVLANLLDNAVKYTERGSVRVTLGVANGRAWCEVGDTGPGIPARDLPRVFERFYRVDKARSREKGGTGLGLSIVKHALAQHGGEVSVVSRVGVGTTFRFEVPVDARD
jgi:two-component system phosphate regulon sensor histidine kinase PhoR